MSWSDYTQDWSERDAVVATTAVALVREAEQTAGKLGAGYAGASVSWTEGGRLVTVSVTSSRDDDDTAAAAAS